MEIIFHSKIIFRDHSFESKDRRRYEPKRKIGEVSSFLALLEEHKVLHSFTSQNIQNYFQVFV